MLSRITRMTSLGAHLATGCSVLKEAPSAPKPVAKVDSSTCGSSSFRGFQEKSLGSSPDPFLWHDHENFLAELAELDPWRNESSVAKASVERFSPSPDDSEWNGILNSVGWIDKLDAFDIPNLEYDHHSDYSQSSASSGFNDLLEKSASLIDWKAWNSYLGDLEEDLEPDSGVAIEKLCPVEEVTLVPMDRAQFKCEDNGEVSTYEPASRDKSVQSASPISADAIDNELDVVEKAIVRGSGPLVWLPSAGVTIDEGGDVPGRRTHSVDEYSGDSKTVKRRGVKMKPPSDEETNHRRSLNREAAFRYRERKRVEQMERKRELEHLLYRNSLLKNQVKDLHNQISCWKKKLSDSGYS